MKKKAVVSTDLFKNKQVPEFIKNYKFFKEPVPVNKIFPIIGIPNFKEQANIDKCLADLKKEGSYVFNALRSMLDVALTAKDNTLFMADRIQYLSSKEDREKNRERLFLLYELGNILTNLVEQVDPYNQNVLDKAVVSSEGKITLRLISDIVDSNGKVAFGSDRSLFRVFARIREMAQPLGISVTNLDQLDSIKTFSKENIPNKQYNIVFSSEGEEGAWDILTMSMRGIKSCQRWDGDYPRCLIGSVLSRFVGIIYLTSGVQADANLGFTSLGTKMMRRCVVRYVINADEGSPCILLDKMYPDLDKDVLNLFVSSIKSKTSIPVHYAPDMIKQMKHMYLPDEKIRNVVATRDWSYQDTPLKTRTDVKIALLNSSKEEMDREVKAYRTKLSIFLARQLDAVYNRDIQSDEETRRTVSNLRMCTSFTPFADQATTIILNSFKAPAPTESLPAKEYCRKYLLELLAKRKNVINAAFPHLKALIEQNTSRDVNIPDFVKFLTNLVVKSIKQEIIDFSN